MHRSLVDAWNAVSLRSKITGVTVLVLTFGLLLSGIGTMMLLKPVLLLQLDQQLDAAAQATTINAMLGAQTAGGGTVAGDGESGDYFVALYSASGALQMHNWEDDPTAKRPSIPASLTIAQGKACAASGAYDLSSADGVEQFRARCTAILFNGTGEQGTAIVATSTAQISSVMASYLTIFLGFSVIVVVVGAILTRMLVTTTFQPLREVERAAAAIADGDYSQRLGGAEPNTEVGRLNRSLNTMLSRIDRAFRDRARTIEQMRRFVGDASHELRTPLVSVRGYAELYRMGALPNDEAVTQAMERIEKEAVRMGGLVEDLLQLARLDETKPLAVAPVDLLPLATDAALDAGAANPARAFHVVATLPPAPSPLLTAPVVEPEPVVTRPVLGRAAQPRAEQSRLSAGRPARRSRTVREPREPLTRQQGVSTATGPIALAVARLRRGNGRRPDAVLAETAPLALDDLPEARTVPAVVLADGDKLRQVLNNLIGNAVRYTPAGTPIEIGVTVELDSKRAFLEVIDHGDGIPAELHEKIFQRFWRADTSRTRDTGGSGLGLAIVSSIVAAHRGSVDVVDTPGGGATFRVGMPLAEAVAAPAASGSPATPPAPGA